jgi:two-component system chemotaxis response regulator CheY
MRILIVEDDYTSRTYLKGLLGKFGECVEAEDGVLAVAAFKEAMENNKPFDLIIMDIMMPNMDGHEALQEIRNLERLANVPPLKETKVIMATALSDPKNVVRAYYKGGATAYLPKPVDKAVLLETVKELGLAPGPQGKNL